MNILRRLLIVAAAVGLAGALAGPALSTSTTVTLADVSGSRTLTVTDAAGGSLNAATLSTGAGASMPFVANVTDVLYDNVTYDVDASMSNLYLVDPDSGTGYDCDVFIPAGDLSISWPTEAFAFDDIEALVTDVLFDVQGTVPLSLDATLNTVLATATGLTLGTDTRSGTDLSRSGQGLTETTVDTVKLASEALLSDLPLAISVGSAGAFSAADGHSVCGDAASTPTAINLQSGDVNGAFSLADVATAVEAALRDAADVVSGGHLTESEVLNGIFTDAELTRIQNQVSTLGLGAAWDSYVTNTLLPALSLQDVSISTLVGQTGTYTSVPSLNVAPDLTVSGAGTAPAGVVNAYQGDLVITLTSS